jgi:hypothetical protein
VEVEVELEESVESVESVDSVVAAVSVVSLEVVSASEGIEAFLWRRAMKNPPVSWW